MAVVMIDQNPAFQIIIMMLLNITVQVSILILKPFEIPSRNHIEFYNEICISVITYMFIVFTVSQGLIWASYPWLYQFFTSQLTQPTYQKFNCMNSKLSGRLVKEKGTKIYKRVSM
eukprot:403356465